MHKMRVYRSSPAACLSKGRVRHSTFNIPLMSATSTLPPFQPPKPTLINTERKDYFLLLHSCMAGRVLGIMKLKTTIDNPLYKLSKSRHAVTIRFLIPNSLKRFISAKYRKSRLSFSINVLVYYIVRLHGRGSSECRADWGHSPPTGTRDTR